MKLKAVTWLTSDSRGRRRRAECCRARRSPIHEMHSRQRIHASSAPRPDSRPRVVVVTIRNRRDSESIAKLGVHSRGLHALAHGRDWCQGSLPPAERMLALDESRASGSLQQPTTRQSPAPVASRDPPGSARATPRVGAARRRYHRTRTRSLFTRRTSGALTTTTLPPGRNPGRNA